MLHLGVLFKSFIGIREFRTVRRKTYVVKHQIIMTVAVNGSSEIVTVPVIMSDAVDEYIIISHVDKRRIHSAGSAAAFGHGDIDDYIAGGLVYNAFFDSQLKAYFIIRVFGCTFSFGIRSES